MRAALMPAVVAAVQITSPSHHDASQIRETFYNLAAAKAGNGGQIDNETEANVNRILKLVGETLMSALWEDRDAAQRSYNLSIVAVNNCNGELKNPDLTEYDRHKGLTAKMWNSYAQCLADENEICANRTQVCGDLDQYVCDLKPCNDYALDADKCVECKEEAPTNSSLYTALQCLIDFDAKHFNTYRDKYDNCKRHKSDHNRQIGVCDGEQQTLEDQKCKEQGWIHKSCGKFNSCWETQNSSHTQVESTTRNLENIFQKQWTALECLMCYGKQILEDTTNLTVCENASPIDFQCTKGSDTDRVTGATNSLAICYYDPEPKYPCESEFDYCVPGTDEWFGKYGNWTGSCAEVDTVKHSCLEYAI